VPKVEGLLATDDAVAGQQSPDAAGAHAGRHFDHRFPHWSNGLNEIEIAEPEHKQTQEQKKA
jgi:hypothetical protein